MDNNHFPSPKLRAFPGNPDGSLLTHSNELLALIRASLLGKKTSACRERSEPLSIDNVHGLANGVAGYFTDPLDGRRYRLTLEAINVFEGEDQEIRFGSFAETDENKGRYLPMERVQAAAE